jgi:RNA polymerase sigma-70 factor (ECF subfamily)
MQRYCEGDLAAFRALYAETAPRLLGYLRSLLHDDMAAQEVLQQSFLKLHMARSVYVQGMDPVPWLYSIAHRTCIDELRRRRRSRVRLLQTGDDALDRVEAWVCGASQANDTGEAYTDAERSAALDALEALSEEQRIALTLTKIRGLTMMQAARSLGTTEGAVKLRAHRGCARLREILARDEIFHDRAQSARARARRRSRGANTAPIVGQ